MTEKIVCNSILGSNLKRFREATGLSQEKICVKLQVNGFDIGRSTYSKYESGQGVVSKNVLLSLCEIFSCTYDELFSE